MTWDLPTKFSLRNPTRPYFKVVSAPGQASKSPLHDPLSTHLVWKYWYVSIIGLHWLFLLPAIICSFPHLCTSTPFCNHFMPFTVSQSVSQLASEDRFDGLFQNPQARIHAW
ncbi:hypothetical protein EX30DRAFT_87509 [Ascodesmis nigricans]|uniref:Uncharacterized protein n=1 Tax=Ascodesmis nigricans TaxID=341454 RepID=A0A4S2N388_9PEZI|nr:hypothetical protein EX30DRAFT_87509 [Ascodesmis nigricans]